MSLERQKMLDRAVVEEFLDSQFEDLELKSLRVLRKLSNEF
jgi:hypothetical protein